MNEDDLEEPKQPDKDTISCLSIEIHNEKS
jgi:hypothetical protein